jgi:hypothetical protein
MVKESFPEAPNEVEKKIKELTNAIRDTYGKHYDDLDFQDQALWNELFRFANIEKGDSIKQREVLVESLTSFLSFLESEFKPKE